MIVSVVVINCGHSARMLLLNNLLLFFCLAALVTGIVLAIASLLS